MDLSKGGILLWYVLNPKIRVLFLEEDLHKQTHEASIFRLMYSDETPLIAIGLPCCD